MVPVLDSVSKYGHVKAICHVLLTSLSKEGGLSNIHIPQFLRFYLMSKTEDHI